MVSSEWAAGFFDGEGHTSLGGSRGRYSGRTAQVSVTQVVPDPLFALQDKYGGRGVHKDNKKQGIHTWSIFGKDAIAFLQDVLPYLLVKGPDARSVLSRAYRDPVLDSV